MSRPLFPLFVSVHLPKTAGTSFLKALDAHFGPRLLRDYADLPLNTSPEQRHRAALAAGLRLAHDPSLDGVECVHGHFLPVKYLRLADRRDVTFVTWLRHPVDRVLSHYFFWKRTYDAASSPPLHRRVVEEDWTLERFCLSDELKDVYRQFLWRFPFERFAFVGITEHYDEDFVEFSEAYLGRRAMPARENVRDPESQPHQIDEALRARVAAFHADDMALYAHAVAARRARRGDRRP